MIQNLLNGIGYFLMFTVLLSMVVQGPSDKVKTFYQKIREYDRCIVVYIVGTALSAIRI